MVTEHLNDTHHLKLFVFDSFGLFRRIALVSPNTDERPDEHSFSMSDVTRISRVYTYYRLQYNIIRYLPNGIPYALA